MNQSPPALGRGIEDVRVRLGVAQPGETVADFNDALGRLSDRLTYLYHDNHHRYRYDTHPNLRRTAEDRAGQWEAHEVAWEIEARLRREREKGDVHAGAISLLNRRLDRV